MKWVKGLELRGKDGKTPIAGIDFPIPQNGLPGKDADVKETVQLTLQEVIAEIDKRVPLLGDALKTGLENYIKETIAKQPYSMGGGAVVSIQQSGVLKVNQAANLNFKGTGAPTVTIGANGVTNLDFPGTGGIPVYNEVVAGNTNTFTLAHTPTTGTLRVYARGQRILPTSGFTLTGAIISTVDTLTTGDLYADYDF